MRYTEMAISYSIAIRSLLAPARCIHEKILAMTTALALSGCASITDTYLADGEQALSIDCSGEAGSWASCYESRSLLRRHGLSDHRYPRHSSPQRQRKDAGCRRRQLQEP